MTKIREQTLKMLERLPDEKKGFFDYKAEGNVECSLQGV